jgi:catechol 2,3-dioxygenase-like lactoylglutathione lyase family enzyme
VEKRSPAEGSPVAQVRIARPTDRLAEVVRFYRDALGLEQIASFEDHAGYDGVMLALPGRRDGAFREIAARLKRHGHEPVEPGNPYWAEEGLTFEDPDGWRVVLMHAAGI